MLLTFANQLVILPHALLMPASSSGGVHHHTSGIVWSSRSRRLHKWNTCSPWHYVIPKVVSTDRRAGSTCSAVHPRGCSMCWHSLPASGARCDTDFFLEGCMPLTQHTHQQTGRTQLLGCACVSWRAMSPSVSKLGCMHACMVTCPIIQAQRTPHMHVKPLPLCAWRLLTSAVVSPSAALGPTAAYTA